MSSGNVKIEFDPVTEASLIWPTGKIYKPKWERDPLLKPWIAPHPKDSGKIVCRFCDSYIRAHKNDLLEHTRTLKHKRNYMRNSTQDECKTFLTELNVNRKDPQYKRGSKRSQRRSVSVSTPVSTESTIISPDPAPAPLPPLPSESTPSPLEGVTSSTTTHLSGPTLLNLESDPLGINSTFDEVLSTRDQLWSQRSHEGEDTLSATDTPSDLVSVVLEERPSTNSTVTVPLSSAEISADLDSNLGSMILTELPSFPLNFTLVDNSTLDHDIRMATPIIANSVSNESVSIVSVTEVKASLGELTNSIILTPPRRIKLDVAEVVEAMEGGDFSLNDLCTLAKTAMGCIHKHVEIKFPQGR